MALSDRLQATLERAGRRPPFDRPLRIGDQEQIRVLRIMNGDVPYCPVCYATHRWADPGMVGRKCSQTYCDGQLVPGAEMVRQYPELMKDVAC